MNKTTVGLSLLAATWMMSSHVNAFSDSDHRACSIDNAEDCESGYFEISVATGGTHYVMAVDAPGRLSFEGAEAFCSALSLGEMQDWRLPTVQEAQLLFDIGALEATTNRDDFYWSNDRLSAVYATTVGGSSTSTVNYTSMELAVRCIQSQRNIPLTDVGEP